MPERQGGRRAMPRGLTFGVFALTLLAATAAQAAPQRQPETGVPAVVIEAPDGWTTQRPSAVTLNAFNAGRNGVISITIETTTENPDLTLFRDNVFRAANCAALPRAETAQVGERTGQAFYCQPSQTVLAPVRIVLIRLDPTHVLSVSQTYRLDASGADVQGLEQTVATLRYEGVR